MGDYDWRIDGAGSYAVWCDYMRLRHGFRRFQSVKEMYMLEVWGEIP